MYKDIIKYELAEGITESHLLEVAKEVVADWMSKQEGFQGWKITKDQDGNFVDIVYWDSEMAAKKSQTEMGNIPNAEAWFACYKSGSIKSDNLNVLKRFV